MKITNTELMAKIASGQILPGICKNIQVNSIIDDVIKDDDNKSNQIQQNVQKRLYNKFYNFKRESLNDEKAENNKNIMTSYLIKSREPSITSFVNNNNDLDLNNEIQQLQQLQQVTIKKDKETNDFKSENKTKDVINLLESITINKVQDYDVQDYDVQDYDVQDYDVKDYDVQNNEKTIPLPIEKLAYESGSDIILKGADIILSINKCGLIGNSSKILPELAKEFNTNNVGLLYSNFEFMSPLFSLNEQNLNFNCTKIIYKTNSENKCVINSNLYETTNNKHYHKIIILLHMNH